MEASWKAINKNVPQCNDVLHRGAASCALPQGGQQRRRAEATEKVTLHMLLQCCETAVQACNTCMHTQACCMCITRVRTERALHPAVTALCTQHKTTFKHVHFVTHTPAAFVI